MESSLYNSFFNYITEKNPTLINAIIKLTKLINSVNKYSDNYYSDDYYSDSETEDTQLVLIIKDAVKSVLSELDTKKTEHT
jgi:hypothetical protein